jgi:hypothetical protein
MTKQPGTVASLFLTINKCVVIAGVVFGVTLWSMRSVYAAKAENSCTSATQAEADAVFNQAVSTISSLSNAAVKAKERGSWRPNGSFRKVFFIESGRALRSIRTLLGEADPQSISCTSSQGAVCETRVVPKTELLEAFDQIFSIPFPKGLRSLRRLQKVEREKFISALETLPDNYATCE